MKTTYKGLSVSDWQSVVRASGGIRAAARSNTVPESGIRGFLKKSGVIFSKPETKSKKNQYRPISAGSIVPPDTRRELLNGKRFVFTAAQNNTPVHTGFLESLKHYCKHNEATLLISQFTYNKSGFQNKTKDGIDELWYDPAIAPYVYNTAACVAEGLLFCGELDVIPTAGNPLSGFETYCFGNSGIIPHAKVALQSLPRLKGEPARFLYTTGAVTQRNYIQRKAGQKAEFHHVFGALSVEVSESGQWFVRQLIADNGGSFYDLTNHYTKDGVTTGHEVMAINWGDIHVEKADETVANASWSSSDSILVTLAPTYQFVHDLTDFAARNHHNIKDPYFLARMYQHGSDSVEQDLTQSARLLAQLSNNSLVVVVESNHHEALERWLRESNAHTDPVNARFWHQANAKVFEAIEAGNRDFDVYEWSLNQKANLNNVIFIGHDESFVICNDAMAEEDGKIVGGIECGLHGHRGPNGSRGSSKGFRSIGRKCNLGHSHSAGIVEGVYTAGVSGKLDMDYNKGPSSWSHSHIITYPNGKRAVITINNGKWRA